MENIISINNTCSLQFLPSHAIVITEGLTENMVLLVTATMPCECIFI